MCVFPFVEQFPLKFGQQTQQRPTLAPSFSSWNDFVMFGEPENRFARLERPQ